MEDFFQKTGSYVNVLQQQDPNLKFVSFKNCDAAFLKY